MSPPSAGRVVTIRRIRTERDGPIDRTVDPHRMERRRARSRRGRHPVQRIAAQVADPRRSALRRRHAAARVHARRCHRTVDLRPHRRHATSVVAERGEHVRHLDGSFCRRLGAGSTSRARDVAGLGRRGEPLGESGDREPVGDRPPSARHLLGGPVRPGGLQHDRPRRIGDEETVVIRESRLLVTARPALAVAFEQLDDDTDRLVGSCGPLECESHEIHAEQGRVAEWLGGEHRFVADRRRRVRWRPSRRPTSTTAATAALHSCGRSAGSRSRCTRRRPQRGRSPDTNAGSAPRSGLDRCSSRTAPRPGSARPTCRTRGRRYRRPTQRPVPGAQGTGNHDRCVVPGAQGTGNHDRCGTTGSHDDDLSGSVCAGVRTRNPFRDPGGRRRRRPDQGVRRHPAEHALPVRSGRSTDRRLHRVRRRAVADAEGARTRRSDRSCPRPRPRRRQRRPRGDRDAQLPGVDRGVRRHHRRRRGRRADERLVADRRDGLRARRLRIERRHRRRRPPQPDARRRVRIDHRQGRHRPRRRRSPR